MSIYTAIKATISINEVSTEAFFIEAENNIQAQVFAKELFFNNQQRVFITNNDSLDYKPTIVQSGVSRETITNAQFENWISVMTNRTMQGCEEYAPSFIEVLA